MQDAWTRVDGVIRRSTRVIGTAGLLVLFANACVVVLDVVLRWVFLAPIDRFSDVSSVIFYLAAASCIPVVTAEQRNITIRVFGGLPNRRLPAVIDAVAAAIVAVVLALIVWQIAVYTRELAENGRTLAQIPVQIAPFWAVVTGLLALAFLVQLFVLAKHLRAALGYGSVGAEADAAEASAL